MPESSPNRTALMRFPRSPYLLLTLSSLIWAGNFIVGRGLRASIHPVALAYWRWVGALLILLPFFLRHWREQCQLLRRSWRIMTLYGVLGVACFNTFLYIALQTTTATNALLIDSTVPVMIALISRIFGGETMSGRQVLGVVVSLAGVAVIICRADLGLLLALRLNGGDLWVLLAVACWSFYTYFLRNCPSRAHPLDVLNLMILIGVAALTPFYLWELGRVGGMEPGVAGWGGLCYLSLMASVVAFIMWNRGVALVGAIKAGLFIHLMPVFGILLASLFLGESLHLFQLTGSLLIFGGIFLATTGGSEGRFGAGPYPHE